MRIDKEKNKIIFRTRLLNSWRLSIFFFAPLITFFVLFLSSSNNFLIQCETNNKKDSRYPYDCHIHEFNGDQFLKNEKDIGMVGSFAMDYGRVPKSAGGQQVMLAKTAYGDFEVLRKNSFDNGAKLRAIGELNNGMKLALPFVTVLEREFNPQGYYSFFFLLVSLFSLKSYIFNYKNIKNVEYDGHEHTLKIYDILDQDYIALGLDQITKVEILASYMVYKIQHPILSKIFFSDIRGELWFQRHRKHSSKPQGMNFYINSFQYTFITYMSDKDFHLLVDEFKALIDRKDQRQ